MTSTVTGRNLCVTKFSTMVINNICFGFIYLFYVRRLISQMSLSRLKVCKYFLPLSLKVGEGHECANQTFSNKHRAAHQQHINNGNDGRTLLANNNERPNANLIDSNHYYLNHLPDSLLLIKSIPYQLKSRLLLPTIIHVHHPSCSLLQVHLSVEPP